MILSSTYFITAGFIIIVFDLISKVRLYQIIKSGHIAKATVVGFETVYVKTLFSQRPVDYPKVKYLDEYNIQQTGLVTYAKSKGQYFSVGDEIEIIIYKDAIYFKPALTNSVLSFIGLVVICIGMGIRAYHYWF